MKPNKDNRGGFRENAKRPLKYGEITEVIKFRVPKSKKEIVVKLIHDTLSKWEVKKDDSRL
jgi:hypothetical protein